MKHLSCYHIPCTFQHIQEKDVTYQLAGKHGSYRKPYIASHKSQCNGDNFTDSRKEGEKCHKCSFPLQEVHHFVYLFFLYLEIFLYPAYFAQTSHIVTGHSAYRVAECGGYQAGGRGQVEFDECHQYQFGTERHDAAGQ